MKLAVNIGLSLGMLGLCLWLVWPAAADRAGLARVLGALSFNTFAPYLAGYVALLAATHFFRAWRWRHLLRPMGVELPPVRLLAISSVGFMAILALPARLGEFVRPALLRQKGKVSAAAVLGTVAVERIVDGLLVSLLVFSTCFALRGPSAPGWMMPTAWASLGIFVTAMTFLLLALRWPDVTVRTSVRLSGVRLASPRIAALLEEKLHSLISGFRVLDDRRHLAGFVFHSVIYWAANGLGMWVLARGMGLDLPIVGAFATMGIIAVGITLPNSPGLVGQFHWFTTLGLALYLPGPVAQTAGLAYAIMLHGIQVLWYVGMGALAMITGHVAWDDLWRGTRDDGDRPDDFDRPDRAAA
ncbi:MAG: flippase-like domain-containing protein [Myxococcales bacterium]|nr:flippase-like domain-containing protein [Myxococcales bacterium]